MKGNYLRSMITILAIFAVILFSQTGVEAHVEHSKETPGVGVEEKLGQTVPLDIVFNDESGNRISLRQVINKPTILAPVYFGCPDVCSFLLYNLAGALNQLSSEPGREYQALAVSFDETEKPPLAFEKKRLYLKMIERPFSEEAWRFFTGEEENIRKLTEAIGFRFKREGKTFQHPILMVVLSPNGKITRYMYGTDVLPFDLKMALLEASEGRSGPTVSKVLRFCFSYDPKGRKYVFNTLKVTGIVTLAFALAFVLFLVVKGRRNKPK
jgi:protein SCO1/2